MKLLSDSQMQQFIVNGYVSVKAGFPSPFHQSVYARAEEIFSTQGNPGNHILPAIPQLADLFSHPAVTGALTSILGPGYAMHPHRHCHLTPPHKTAQRHHQDSYEDDQNVRHHRTRWAMAFYYPQDVTVEMGPTSVLPASQYYTSRDQAENRTSFYSAARPAQSPSSTTTLAPGHVEPQRTQPLHDEVSVLPHAGTDRPQLGLYQSFVERIGSRRGTAATLAQRMELARGERALLRAAGCRQRM